MSVKRIREALLGSVALAALLLVGVEVPAASADPGHDLRDRGTLVAGARPGELAPGVAARLGPSAPAQSLTDSSLRSLAAPHGELPNDPRVENLDGIYDAWRITHGSSDVKVAVIDTGVKATHPDLVGKVVGQYNAVTGSLSATDVDGQGTAVASIIGASTNNGIGMAGLAWDTSLLAVRVSDSKGDISDASIARGIDWAVKQGASVINISLYQPESNSTLKAAIARAVAKDVVVVATAGDVTSSWKTYPAAYPGVLAVSAYAETGKGPSGSWVDVSAAPKASAAVAANNGYTTVSGSAYATPQVAAIAALVRAAHPDFTAAKVASVITATAIRSHYHPVPLVDAFAALSRGLSVPGPTVISPADGTVITTGVAEIHVHIPDYVARDIVRYKFVGQTQTYSSDPGFNQTSEQDLQINTLGLLGPQTVQIFRCLAAYCSTTQPSTVTLDIENPALPVYFENVSLGPQGDVAISGVGDVFFANGVRVTDSNRVIPVDELPVGDVELTGTVCDSTKKQCDGERWAPTTIHVARLKNPTLHLSNTVGSKFPDSAHRSTRLTFTVPGEAPVETRLFLGVEPAGLASYEGQPTVDLGLLAPGTYTYDWTGPTYQGSSDRWPVVVETRSPEGLVGRARAAFYFSFRKPNLTLKQSSVQVYPVHDGYRDSATISGTTNVPGRWTS